GGGGGLAGLTPPGGALVGAAAGGAGVACATAGAAVGFGAAVGAVVGGGGGAAVGVAASGGLHAANPTARTLRTIARRRPHILTSFLPQNRALSPKAPSLRATTSAVTLMTISTMASAE